jgi:hypothetical protein
VLCNFLYNFFAGGINACKEAGAAKVFVYPEAWLAGFRYATGAIVIGTATNMASLYGNCDKSRANTGARPYINFRVFLCVRFPWAHYLISLILKMQCGETTG